MIKDRVVSGPSFLDTVDARVKHHLGCLPSGSVEMIGTVVGLVTDRPDVCFLSALPISTLNNPGWKFLIENEIQGFWRSLGSCPQPENTPLRVLEKARERRLPRGTTREDWEKQVGAVQSLAEAIEQQTLLKLKARQDTLEIAEEIAATAKRAVLQIALNRSATPEPGPDYYRLRLFALGARQIELAENNGQGELSLVFLSDQGETITKSYMIKSSCGETQNLNRSQSPAAAKITSGG